MENFMRKLTATEHRIVTLLAKGVPPKKIAQTLYIAYGTVRWHLANLRRDFAVHTTRQLLFELENMSNSVHVAVMVKFTPRGKEVFELFMVGRTYKQICEQLGISRSGVRRHLEQFNFHFI
jgi:DNA-binding CsgD family transcriptional regulator